MGIKLHCNCCDGIYNSFDVHFTSKCDNKCNHCIDTHYNGLNIGHPNIESIVSTIVSNQNGIDDVLFLGGEPCLFLDELVLCIKKIKEKTELKLYVTTAVPKVCYDKKDKFFELINLVDGINLSVQHYREDIADKIRNTVSGYDRQKFYSRLPHKEKIRINLNIVKPYLYTKEDISSCLIHYDKIGFSSIKLSEIQHGKDVYVSFSEVFGIEMPSAYSSGCQQYLDMENIIKGFKTSVLLKRSCFLCEDSIVASLADGLKMATKLFRRSKNNYGVVYENGSLQGGWV